MANLQSDWPRGFEAAHGQKLHWMPRRGLKAMKIGMLLN